jgi:hypothetical protein
MGSIVRGNEEEIRAHFSLPEVQYIGSSTCCGCAFPNVMFQNGGWPELEWSTRDAKQLASDSESRSALGALLGSLGEEMVELYGLWSGDFALPPASREELSIEALLDSSFCLKERGFYTVRF